MTMARQDPFPLVIVLLGAIGALALLLSQLDLPRAEYYRGAAGYTLGTGVPTGFAPPWNPITMTSFFTVTEGKNGSQVELNITASQTGMIIHKTYYVYDTTASTKWTAKSFPQSTVGSTNWILSTASASILVSPTTLDAENYILVYACVKDAAGAWRCGCRDATFATCQKWSIQKYDKPSFCTDDALCVGKSDGDRFCDATNTKIITCAAGPDGCLDKAEQPCGTGQTCMLSGTTPICGSCTTATQCDDTNPCTTDTCVSGACVNSYVANGQACTTTGGSGTCQNGVCTVAPLCGNGVVETGEQCDLGSSGNGACPKTCSATCTTNTCTSQVCGNGVREGTEQCDNGANNGACPKTCSSTCETNTCTTQSCGNGVVETGEQCDNGANNGACPKTCSSTCTTNTCSTATCGNSLCETGETTTSCPTDCQCNLATDCAADPCKVYVCTDHRCSAFGDKPDGTACTSTSGSGTCQAGVCQTSVNLNTNEAACTAATHTYYTSLARWGSAPSAGQSCCGNDASEKHRTHEAYWGADWSGTPSVGTDVACCDEESDCVTGAPGVAACRDEGVKSGDGRYLCSDGVHYACVAGAACKSTPDVPNMICRRPNGETATYVWDTKRTGDTGTKLIQNKGVWASDWTTAVPEDKYACCIAGQCVTGITVQGCANSGATTTSSTYPNSEFLCSNEYWYQCAAGSVNRIIGGYKCYVCGGTYSWELTGSAPC